MSLLEAVRLALNTIRVQKLKSFFTLLGVTIGVMFLITVVSIINGMGRYMEEDLVGKLIAKNSFELRQRPNVTIGEVDPRVWQSYKSRPRITEEDRDAAVVALPPGVRSAMVSDGALSLSSRYAKPSQGLAHAVDGDWFAIKGMTVSSGRLFTDQEYELGAPVVVIGEDVRTRFFPNLDPNGRELRIANIPYTVVGVAEKQGSAFGMSMDQFVVIPYRSTAHRLLNRFKVVSAIILQAPTPEAMQVAMDNVRAVMRARHKLRPSQQDNFALVTSDSALEFWKRIQGFLIWAGVALPTVGLLVGAIVIMNIMLVAVAERTHEIGIRKALGARQRDILSQFLVESATLSTMGAVLGIACGAALAKLISAVSPLPAALALWSVITAVLVGMGVGVVSGVYPASRAAHLDPVTALRHET